MKTESLRLYLVTDRRLAGGRDLLETVRKAVAGGVTMVQLREKDICTRDFVRLAEAMRQTLEGTGVPLIINDRVDVALACEADGVHIGQSDMPYEDARRILGSSRIIGLSVENMEQVLQAEQTDADYIGVSPVFSTPTKTDTAAPFGTDGLRQAAMISSHPCVAIGGIGPDNAAEVIGCGAAGIAVVSAVISADDPLLAAQRLRTETDRAFKSFKRWA